MRFAVADVTGPPYSSAYVVRKTVLPTQFLPRSICTKQNFFTNI